MGRKYKYTFLQRGPTDGQQTYEKMLNITIIEEKHITTTVGIILHWSESPSSKNLQTINAREDKEKWEPSCTVGWNVNWRTLWRFSDGSDTKESACNTRDPGWIPGLGRSPGGGNGNPL